MDRKALEEDREKVLEYLQQVRAVKAPELREEGLGKLLYPFWCALGNAIARAENYERPDTIASAIGIAASSDARLDDLKAGLAQHGIKVERETVDPLRVEHKCGTCAWFASGALLSPRCCINGDIGNYKSASDTCDNWEPRGV